MTSLLSMSTREYRALENGSTRTLPPSILTLALAGLRVRLSDRTRSADSRARKRASKPRVKTQLAPRAAPTRGRDSL